MPPPLPVSSTPPEPADATPVAAPPVLTESVVVPRFIATATARDQREADGLLRAAGLPTALHDPDTARVPSTATYRLWGEVVTRTGREDAGLLAAGQYRSGLLDVFDYLMSSAPTLGEGLIRTSTHLHLLSSNSVLTRLEDGDELTVGYEARHGDDELRGVVAEFALALMVRQLRYVTGTEFTPRRVGFTHRGPHRDADYEGAFGGAPIDFGMPADTVTFHSSDLELPLVTADASLAAIMMRTAASVPAPRPPDNTALPGLYEAIAAQLPAGRPSLADAARRLTISTRTLQRRLSESGTTWRAELDAVRREQADGLRHEGAGPAQRAARLGYAESRSLRRAMNRWDSTTRTAAKGAQERPERTDRQPARRGGESALHEPRAGGPKPADEPRRTDGRKHELIGEGEATRP